MADHSELSTADYEGDDRMSDTTATIPSADSGFLSPIPRNDDDTKESSDHTPGSHRVVTPTTPTDTNNQRQRPRHRRRKSGGKHKVRIRSPSPSPGVSSGSGAGKKRDNVAMRKILDAAPKMIAVDEEDRHFHHKAVSRVLNEVYFDGNWNRGHYAVDTANKDEVAESEEKEEIRSRGYEPLTVFTDDEMFKLLPSQRKENRLDKGHFAPYQYRRSPFPLPSQRLKRALYPFKEWKNEELQNAEFKAKIKRLHEEEQDHYSRMRMRATNLKKLYQDVTKLQMVDPNQFPNIHAVKRQRWKEWTENPPSSLGAIQEGNIPPWVNGKNGL